MYCWASCLGDCAGGQSGEHVLSECLWEGDAVGVFGGPWAPTAPKTIGLQAIKSNILCARHNSALSPVDTEGGRAFDAFRKVVVQENLRRAKKPKILMPIEYRLRRGLLERWFLKSTINLVVASKSPREWLLSGTPIREPPEEFVRAAFGLDRLADPMGLYVAPRRGEAFLSDDRVMFTSLIDPDDRLAGAEFRFRGLQFAVWLSREPLPPTQKDESGSESMTLVRRARWVWERDGQFSQAVEVVD